MEARVSRREYHSAIYWMGLFRQRLGVSFKEAGRMMGILINAGTMLELRQRDKTIVYRLRSEFTR